MNIVYRLGAHSQSIKHGDLNEMTHRYGMTDMSEMNQMKRMKVISGIRL